MFKVTMGKGVHIAFANGWAVSVQWGPGNYCDNYNITGFSPEDHREAGGNGSETAECAVFNPAGDFVDVWDHGDDVKGYCTADEVVELMLLVSTKER